MDKTKYYKRGTIFLKIMDICLTFLPLIGFIIYAFATGSTTEKVVFGMIAIAGVVLAALSIISKYSFRGSIYLLLLGLYLCIKNITIILIILSICTLLDELLIVPLYKMYKEKYTINKEIDERQD